MITNIYFALTEVFNAEQPTVALASGQAVVYYRIAIMSKDGDWVIRESVDACARVLAVLDRHGARYRPAAPLDVRWLAGGWSSHFEFFDERQRRVRCDFVSRPPRVPTASIEALFAGRVEAGLRVVDVESLILMKQTQRAKDYAAIGPLAALLPPDREIALTTDPDRLLQLAPGAGSACERPAIQAARAGAGRRSVVLALAEEADELQRQDRLRVDAYERSAAPFLAEVRRHGWCDLPLVEAHARICDAASRLLPVRPGGDDDADAQ